AAKRLWDGPFDIDQVSPTQEVAGPLAVERGSRQIAVTLTDLGRGHLAILRDITAERTLEQKRREMQRLVSHELKTPLSSIAGFGENLERYDLDGEEQRRVASLIRGEAQRLQEMVTVFLDLERLGGGHWDGATETVDLGHLVNSRLEVLEAAAASKDVGIARSLADGCRVRAVPSLLDRVVDNLVGKRGSPHRSRSRAGNPRRRNGPALRSFLPGTGGQGRRCRPRAGAGQRGG
ncbi:MAG: HAMP domain-containing sensor histidine kinase, partial [Acidobacteriota bacterium]